MSLLPSEIYDIVLYQVAALKGICESLNVKLHHVKPHGALYNQAAKNGEMAAAIARAVRAVDPKLIFYGGSGTELVSEAEKYGLITASEVFADRTYQADGSLTPRTRPDALITDENMSIAQAIQMITKGRVDAISGESICVRADTICIHGDGEHALEFAVALRNAFAEHGIAVKSIN
jgi:UPF0271 protein